MDEKPPLLQKKAIVSPAVREILLSSSINKGQDLVRKKVFNTEDSFRFVLNKQSFEGRLASKKTMKRRVKLSESDFWETE